MKMLGNSVIGMFLLMTLVFAFSSIAQNVSEKKNVGAVEENNIEAVQQQNQGEEKEVENQATEQIGESNNFGSSVGENVQKEEIKTGTEQNKSENNKSSSESSSESSLESGKKVQNQEQNQEQNQSNQREENRSRVASAVQDMLAIADRNEGIGQQIRTVAQNQEQNQQEMEVELNKSKSRSGIVKFIIGPNYKELKKVENRLEKNNKNLDKLKKLRDQVTNDEDKNIMEQQIQFMQQIQLDLENEVKNEKKGASLLGWLFKWFA